MHKTGRSIALFFIGCFVLSFLGGLVGLVIGMTIGGNYPPVFEYGGLPGYEGLGLLGSILGFYLVFYIYINQWLVGEMYVASRVSLLCSFLIELAAQDQIARRNGVGFASLMLLPFFTQAILFIVYHAKSDSFWERGQS